MSQPQKTILIADDDPAIVDSLRMILELFEYRVESTLDGAVLCKARQHQPDLLILDIWMSGVDGRDVCRDLKGDRELKHIPVIMISASKDVSISSKAAGADDFLEKPFEMDELLVKVQTYIQ